MRFRERNIEVLISFHQTAPFLTVFVFATKEHEAVWRRR
jgi:hypothetical protein